ncbi:MAG: hypothetical protein DMG40_18970 [Acidobacteria bacterium]|nr:MAG: hypothetical protein DMG40_18970 [Acidobacteriota bacterium]
MNGCRAKRFLRLLTSGCLAALTIEYGGILQTNDRDFARFPGLRLNNPCTSACVRKPAGCPAYF